MKKNLVRALLILSFFIALVPRAGAQKLDSLLDNYSVNYRQERLYLHYDKSMYAPGDTIWFKAYLMTDFYPSEDSKTIYVDWLDEAGNLMLHTVAPVLEASSNGQFAVPENYPGNAVRVRAYTRWMLNFDSSFLYNKVVRLLPKTGGATGVRNQPKTSVQFLPEGGDLVAGLDSRIAFKATDQWGQPVEVSGTVNDEAGTLVQNFKSTHHGMGLILMQPKPGTSYTASWKDARGEKGTASLPAVRSSGVTLTVTPIGAKRNVTLRRSPEGDNNLQRLYLVGTMFQTKVFSTTADLSTTTSVTKLIPTASLPSGILTITVFDAAHRAIAERITFIRHENYSFQPELNVRVYGLNKRAKNQWELKIPDSLSANLSISVTDAAIGNDSSENIYANVLLTNDLKGIVHKPAAYFEKATEETAANLDLVMLTNGWRRFNWEEVASGKQPVIKQQRETSYLSFSGKIYGLQPGRQGGENLIALLKSRDSAMSQMLVVPIMERGEFSQPDFIFFDTLQVFYQFKKGSALSNASIRFMENRLGSIGTKSLPAAMFRPLGADTSGLAYQQAAARDRRELKEFLSAKVLENVTVRSRTKSRLEELDKRYASGLFSGFDSYQFDLTENGSAVGAANIFQFLQGKVAGLQIRSGSGGTALQWRGTTPSVYLNEVATDVDMLSSLPVTDIAYIKVFRPPFMGGFNGAGGAIAIYTKRGLDGERTAGKGLDNATIAGYTPIKEFYSPDYGRYDARHEQRDLRTTIYWNPFLVTNPKNNTIKLTFYNNDVTKAFRVIIEGVTKDGKLAHLETIVE